jgi:predicted neuraminidase
MKKIILLAAILGINSIIAGSDPYKGDKCIIKSEFIYQPHDVNFPGCHASTIVQISDGLLTAWFGGTAEKNPDVGIWLSRFNNGSWTKPAEVADGVQYKGKRYPCWNPVLFNNGGKILLFFKVGPSPSEWWGEMITSDDNGITWSRNCRLPEDIYGPVKNKPVLLGTGELLCPSSTENDGWRIHMEFTADNGQTWERTAPLNNKKTGAIQPAILKHPEAKLQLLCRSEVSLILSSWSEDNGRTWSDLTSSGLPNPNAGIDAVTLKDGRHLLVYNHLVKGRNMLNVAVSDNGTEWKAAVLLENDATGTEYSYPAVIQTNDNLIHITYTWNRKLIKHVIIDPEKIVTKPLTEGRWPEAL